MNSDSAAAASSRALDAHGDSRARDLEGPGRERTVATVHAWIITARLRRPAPSVSNHASRYKRAHSAAINSAGIAAALANAVVLDSNGHRCTEPEAGTETARIPVLQRQTHRPKPRCGSGEWPERYPPPRCRDGSSWRTRPCPRAASRSEEHTS